jgi:protein-S-isoprenylcysteine O-methyltransferase Ste14
MPLDADLAFAAAWLLWALYWWAASFDVKPTVRRESIASRLSHVVPLALAVALLVPRAAPLPALAWRWLPPGAGPHAIGLSITLMGLLFTVWARRWLGTDWSAVVTVKAGHRLVTDGPYRFVRHPIYAGLLLAMAGTTMARGDLRALLALALALVAFWRKLRIEEAWMRQQFGAAYEAYARRVAALIPRLL